MAYSTVIECLNGGRNCFVLLMGLCFYDDYVFIFEV